MSFFVSHRIKAKILRACLLASLGLSACSTTPPVVRTTTPNLTADVYDPIEGFNRGVYKFNEGADKFIISPLANIYDFILPKFARKGVTNVAALRLIRR